MIEILKIYFKIGLFSRNKPGNLYWNKGKFVLNLHMLKLKDNSDSFFGKETYCVLLKSKNVCQGFPSLHLPIF